jgi:hypothetical protein
LNLRTSEALEVAMATAFLDSGILGGAEFVVGAGLWKYGSMSEL